MHFSSYLKWHISLAQNSLSVSLIPLFFLFCLLEEPVLGPDHLGQHLVKCSGSLPSASPPPPPTSYLPTPPTAPILVPPTLPLKLHWIPWLVDAWWVEMGGGQCLWKERNTWKASWVSCSFCISPFCAEEGITSGGRKAGFCRVAQLAPSPH